MDKTLSQLEAVLREQLTANERLGELVAEKLDAMRRSDHRRVVACSALENQQLKRLTTLENERLELVAALTLMVKPGATEPMRMGELAQAMCEPARGRLLVLREMLRSKMEEVRQKAGVARQSAQALSNHMSGLIQTVGGAVTGVATYSQKGNRPRAAVAVSTFSTTA
ncbi:MAG: hypothetical protein GC164_05280 [Phycisphaera sp.]|nr:hypothetical protein [Phycisphaera sp.]